MTEEKYEIPEISQVKVFRNSGRPIDPEDDSRYVEDWKMFYDKAKNRAGLDMLKLNRMLSFGAYALQKKHYKDTYVKTFKEIAELQVRVGYPILMGLDAASYELICVIQDV